MNLRLKTSKQSKKAKLYIMYIKKQNRSIDKDQNLANERIGKYIKASTLAKI